jgi:hypothetical protein
MAMVVVMVAKIARGMDTTSRTRGATAYSGFHRLSSTLRDPMPSCIVDGRSGYRCGVVEDAHSAWKCRDCGDAKLDGAAPPTDVNKGL